MKVYAVAINELLLSGSTKVYSSFDALRRGLVKDFGMAEEFVRRNIVEFVFNPNGANIDRATVIFFSPCPSDFRRYVSICLFEVQE